MSDRTVLIATAPRSGSWLLAEGLRDLGVGRPEEYFRVDVEDEYRRRWGLPPTGLYPAYLAAARTAGSANGIFAAKLHWFQLAPLLQRIRADHPRSDNDLALLDHEFGRPTFVYLERADTLRQAISWHRAIASDQWWTQDDSPAPPDGSYDFEGVKHLHYLLLDMKRSWRAWFAHHGVVPIEVSYEQLASAFEATMSELVERLGVPRQVRIPPPFLRRQADARTERWVRTFEASWQALFPDRRWPAGATTHRK